MNNELSSISACAMALSEKGYSTAVLENAAEAAELILEEIPVESSIGCGGSQTIKSLGVLEKLRDRGNRVICHWLEGGNFAETLETRKAAMSADYYLTSTNALSVDGKLVNIDGVGNRVAGMTFGPGQVIVVSGRNKITRNLDEAMHRAKNVAAPLNAKRFDLNLPCAKAGKCVDCNNPLRICCVTTIFERKPMLTDIKVILVNEDLGF